jgi:UDP-3-O-[3-hydroxymyristoyl] glucosamine N-acyltransferase
MARNGVAAPQGKSIVYCANPYVAYLELAKLFAPAAAYPAGIDPTAVVGAGFQQGERVSIGAHVIVEDDVVVGDGVAIRPGCFIGSGSRIGDDTLIYPNVCVRERSAIGARVIIHCGAVIGSDGFGFVRDGSRQLKVPQTGTVEIGDDVEIGANCTIDRGAVGVTRIGRGSKLDNLVHVGHNVTVGEDTLLVAQVGIGGSTTIGSRVTLAGQVGVVGHIQIGDDAIVGGQSGVTKSIPAKARWSGYPARPHAENLRAQAAAARIEELTERLRELEARLRALEAGR